MKTLTIKQTVIFNADPPEVYEALLDEKKHARFTGGRAVIGRKVGGKFSVFDDYQIGVPAEFYAYVKRGWADYYWQPLKAML